MTTKRPPRHTPPPTFLTTPAYPFHSTQAARPADTLTCGSGSEHAAGVLGPIMQTTIPPMATAEQLAATITWLLSDDASNVNGAILPSDGGWSAI